MSQFTAAEKAECAEREVKQRRKVYPRLVEAGKMSGDFAAKQELMMAEIAREYRAKAKAEEAEGRLI